MKYLQSNSDRASGELTIKGTRIRVAQAINMLANGFTLEELHSDWWPHLSADLIRGAIEEATQHLSTTTHA